MIDSNFLNYSCLETLNVSRETFPELEKFRETILEKNKAINLISKDSEIASRERQARVLTAQSSVKGSMLMSSGQRKASPMESKDQAREKPKRLKTKNRNWTKKSSFG